MLKIADYSRMLGRRSVGMFDDVLGVRSLSIRACILTCSFSTPSKRPDL